MDMDYYACESCGIPGHKRDNCHEYLQKYEDARRKLYWLDVYHGDTPSFNPYYKHDNLDEILREVKLNKINRALAEPHLAKKKQLFWLKTKSARAEETVDEEVTDLPGQENESTNSIEEKSLESLVISEIQVHPNPPLASITQPTKVGEEGLRTKKKKVAVQDIGQIIMKWLRNSVSIYMTISVNQFWNWQVNYRAFVGNVAGKCSLRPP
ncbi:hypothetical protein QVD17_34952 [Tagetes erecta]|uniref:CCHC-type domain-containing protein n=1 Tax=Tagetes erecta TaxID=13708 RepID=A0AAD8K172_TARER|nr:hypothetical protein QVD17_34952 [Tagetes erecta]